MLAILATAISLIVSLYTFGFALQVKASGNTSGAWGVFFIALASFLLPAYMLFFRR